MNKAKIELTIRLTLNIPRLVEHLLCDFLRSAVLFWNPNYGDILLILDEEDKPNNFESELNSLGLPFKFRFAYEKDLLNQSALDSIKKNQSKLEREMKNGKLRMFYSSFLMDLYTADDVIIGWTDTDAIFTIPVTDESIFNEDGKLIVKGIAIIPNWRRQVKFTALGLPHLANFMSSFPTPVYPSTIRNRRNYTGCFFSSQRINITITRKVIIQFLIGLTHFTEDILWKRDGENGIIIG